MQLGKEPRAVVVVAVTPADGGETADRHVAAAAAAAEMLLARPRRRSHVTFHSRKQRARAVAADVRPRRDDRFPSSVGGPAGWRRVSVRRSELVFRRSTT